MKKIWYLILRAYVKMAFFFFYKKVRVNGKENIPKHHPAILLPNHQNSFTDALMIAITDGRITHYLARADVFQKPFLKWLMSTFNLHPIYRMRDGAGTLNKNEEIFQLCYDALARNECVMLHPEGTHSLTKNVRNLSKGFSRIAFGAMEKYPELRLDIIPVGINYSAPTKIGSSVSVYYGKPIDPRAYANGDKSVLELRDAVSNQLKKLTIHIENEEDHDMIYKKLRDGNYDLTAPEVCNAALSEPDFTNKVPSENNSESPAFLYYLLFPLVFINSWVLILIWKLLKNKIKDPAFHGAMKFSIGMLLLPLIYLINTLVVSSFFGGWIALLYLLLSIIAIRSIALLESREDHIVSS